MNIGRFQIEHLSEGIFENHKDGTFNKLAYEDHIQSEENKDYKKVRKIGIDPILIKTGKHNILVDTGLGWGLDHNSEYTHASNIVTNLDIFGLTPEDITHVVLTHLHYDHAGGSTYVDAHFKTQTTLPFANYFVQKIEWLYALEQVQNNGGKNTSRYELDELYKLEAEYKLVHLTDHTTQLVPGIELIHTGGHTPGHQIVKIQDKGETAYIFGDLIPDDSHINQYSTKKEDIDPLQVVKAKTLLLRKAFEENAVLLFYHSIHTKAGRLLKDVDQKYVLEVVK